MPRPPEREALLLGQAPDVPQMCLRPGWNPKVRLSSSAVNCSHHLWIPESGKGPRALISTTLVSVCFPLQLILPFKGIIPSPRGCLNQRLIG